MAYSNHLRLVNNWHRVPLIIALSFLIAYCQPKLLICIPGKQNTQRLQNDFDALLGTEKVIVLGRIKDLESLLPANPDAVIISTGLFFNYVPGYTPILIGKKRKHNDEKFLIVTTSKEISKENLAGKKTGIVEVLVKDQLQRFVHDQFNLDSVLLKKVNKEDDLLTMLGIEAVDAIIVTESQYSDILSNTKLPLTIIATSKQNTSFLVCALKNGKPDTRLTQALEKMPVALLKEIGIDLWEKP